MSIKKLKDLYNSKVNGLTDDFSQKSWLSQKFISTAVGGGSGFIAGQLAFAGAPYAALAVVGVATMLCGDVIRRTGLQDWKYDLQSFNSFLNFGSLSVSAILAFVIPLAAMGYDGQHSSTDVFPIGQSIVTDLQMDEGVQQEPEALRVLAFSPV